MKAWCFVVTIAATLAACGSSAEQDLRTQEARNGVLAWFETAQSPSDGKLAEQFASGRTTLRTGDRAAIERLFKVAGDSTRPAPIRENALLLAYDKYSCEVAGVYYDFVTLLLDRLADWELAENSSTAEDRLLLNLTLDNLCGERWKDCADDSQLQVLARAIVAGPIDLGARSMAIDRVVRSSSADASTAAAMVIRDSTASAEVDIRLVKALLPPDIDSLRTRFIAALDGGNFRFGEASALAHLGDVQAYDALVAHRARVTAVFESDYIEYYLWQIDVQRTAESLLYYIKTRDREDDSRRIWAIGRAAEKMIDPGLVRAAILAHAATVKPVLRCDGGSGFWRPTLRSIKDASIRVGAISEEDLPDVPAWYPVSK